MNIKSFYENNKAELYRRWKRIKKIGCCEEWHDLEEWLNWCLVSGYDENSQLFKIDAEKEYSPENCYWRSINVRPLDAEDIKFANSWNKTVNSIRLKLGRDPLGEKSCGCCVHEKVCKYTGDDTHYCEEFIQK